MEFKWRLDNINENSEITMKIKHTGKIEKYK